MRRALPIAVLAACGGESVTDSPDAAPPVDAAPFDAASFDAGDPDGASGDLDGALGDAACTPAVGATVVEHACLHVMHGPFATAMAGADPATVTASINTPHTYYTIDLVPDGDRHRGAVLYRPAQDGDHAFFVDPSAALTITAPDGAALPIAAAHDVATCDGIRSAVVVRLARQVRYRVIVPAIPGPSLRVVVENLDSFAPEDAWTCR